MKNCFPEVLLYNQEGSILGVEGFIVRRQHDGIKTCIAEYEL